MNSEKEQWVQAPAVLNTVTNVTLPRQLFLIGSAVTKIILKGPGIDIGRLVEVNVRLTDGARAGRSLGRASLLKIPQCTEDGTHHFFAHFS